MKSIATGLSVSLAILSQALIAVGAAPLPNVVSGDVRVQLLSDSLVRLEQKGPSGFEDRATFHVVNRNWPGTAFTTHTNSDEIVVSTMNYVIRVPKDAKTLDGIRVESASGQRLYSYDGALENSRWLPGPAEKPMVWLFADSPRLIPPTWGLAPAPPNCPLPETSGWDLGNDATDVYVFVPGGDYRRLRSDFLKLTGPTEMPPLFAFGTFDSRWYDYTESTALKQIDDYRQRKIPLDVLVVDTGWRQNASTGYQPNAKLFPNMTRFFQRAHAKHVRVMFNDHPEPKAARALDPVELKFRYDGLSGLLKEGLDVWWFDRNWVVALVPPMPGLRKEVWGMQLYHDITQRVRPESRPLIMANVDGIDNGIRKHAPDVAAHRFPIQWTGDTRPSLDYLRRGVENTVYSGVQALFPYMSEDLGGHVPDPTTEGYIRWIEYGALSPVYRPHCTHNLKRMPWSFGPQAERVARRFLNMRYRLLPVFYAAARENYETGEPLLRRLDLNYPQFAEASRNDEYLIGNGILVAPVFQEQPLSPVPADWLKTTDGQAGLHGEYFSNETLSGSPVLTRTDRTVDFNWGAGSPDPRVPNDHFSARWTGTIEVPKDVGDVYLTTIEDDGARLWLDGKQAIDAWGGHNSARTEASSVLSAGQPHQLRIEYLEMQFDARLQLQYRRAAPQPTARELWIPPGIWIDAWTGHSVTGPATMTNNVPVDRIPIFVKSGTVLPLAPEMQYTGQLPWDPITLDLYPQAGEISQAILYEDDTLTPAYQRGQFRKTPVTVSADGAKKTVSAKIDAADGSFSGASKRRAWILRIHRPVDWPENLVPATVKIGGRKVSSRFRRISRNVFAMPFGDQSGAPDADVFELNLPSAPVTSGRTVEVSFAAGR
ncbi:MAG TPA: TIM-barrel domain-containing protein [Verrucomicrobiae bacterium]|nr:TIM-barrel domain-containing protein [Verrucomicrobiae bacterium]